MSFVRLIPGAVVCVALTAPLFPQTNPRPEFDVASVKPNLTDARPASDFPMGPGNAYNPNGGYFSASNQTVVTYIAFALRIMGDQAEEFLAQLPKWATQERFDIQARVRGNPTKDEMRAMVRSLLEDRFHLAVHYETKQIRALALTVAKEGKLGPQMQAHASDSSCPTNADPSGVADDERFPELCGGIVGMRPRFAGRVRAGARNVTMELIAKSLTGRLGSRLPLVDRTGLTGTFDFNLEWTPENTASAGPNVEVDKDGPTFEQAMRDQLGLKLVSVTASQSVLVLDRLERPTAN